MKPGDIIWVRDPLHPAYKKWTKAFYIRDEPPGSQPPGSRMKIFVEYIDPATKQPLGVCGSFPECKESLDESDEKADREYA